MPEENSSAPGLYTEQKAIAFLESIGYRVFSEEKMLVRGSHNAAERYSLRFLREHLSYDDMLQQAPYDKDIIVSFFVTIKEHCLSSLFLPFRCFLAILYKTNNSKVFD